MLTTCNSRLSGLLNRAIDLLIEYLLWHLEDVPSSNLACMHQLIHLGQLLQVNNLEGRLDHTTSEEVNGLVAILSVSDV
jgi:hypothetical protein